MSESHRFLLANSADDIARLRVWLAEMAAAVAASEVLAEAIHLCVVEAATNVVSYAFAPGTTHTIDLTLAADSGQVVVVIVDDGIPFDPLAHVPRPPTDDLAEVAIGGLGIPLLRKLTTALRYRREGQHNRLELVFAR